MKYRISIFGAGYVGISLSMLLARENDVILYDIDNLKIEKINSNQSPILESEIQDALSSNSLFLNATTNLEEACKSRDIYIIATPTNYLDDKGSFDTKSVESSIKKILDLSAKGLIVIKSTVPVGFTQSMNLKFKTDRIVFSPEFLREGSALNDNLHPSRVIVGGKSKDSLAFGELLKSSANSSNFEVLHMSNSEAEAVKLFSNTYLALRVAFFNELDSFALEKELNAENIITGVSLDHRIGSFYNNPSFGYGGYCLPKDTKQLLSNYEDVPQNIIRSIIQANETRKEFIAKKIIDMQPKVVGVYRLIMKNGSDNLRYSSVLDVIKILESEGIKIIIYEPQLENISKDSPFNIEKSIKDFRKKADLIIANRLHEDLANVEEKVFSRDIFKSS